MDKRLEYLFKKHTENTLTPSEHLEFMSKIDEGQYLGDINELADNLWDNEQDTIEIPEKKATEIFNNVINIQEEARVFKLKSSSSNAYRIAAIAAIVLIVASITFFFIRQRSVQPSAPLLVKEKAMSEHKLVKLFDGSSVILNKNSFLTYTAGIKNGKREVTLVGEGYFDIKHDASHPFIVHAGKLLTTVLGTAFNIKAYDQDRNITITVTRGRVSVSNADHLLGVIDPNQQIAFNKSQQAALQMPVNASETVRWQSNDLFFNDLSMQDAAYELEKRFHVKISFDNDAVKKCRFTGTFLNGEKLTDILKVICDFNNATYKTIAEGHIEINGPGC